MSRKKLKSIKSYPVCCRRSDLHYLLTCIVCRKEIKKGESYHNKKGDETHVNCT